MSSVKTSESARAYIASLANSTSGGRIDYSSMAENYDRDLTALGYRGPSLAAKLISSHFSGDREAAVVLDVACGTGLVAKQLEMHGFRQFVGVDGSKKMLELVGGTGLYQELKQCLLGEEPLPVQWGSFDVVVIVGAMGVGHVPSNVVRELCMSAKPGGYICMSVRDSCNNAEYKAALEKELKQMEEEGLWTCVEIAEEKEWIKSMADEGHEYFPGVLYLYKKIQ